eukprot:m.192059 g.192059  ORF g.192059 m.192059 type:complete len:76 (-) comp25728_c0_seq15:37-264(-)
MHALEPSKVLCLLGWTGSDMFERNLRHIAETKKFHLSNHGFEYLGEPSYFVKVEKEEDVFTKLGLEYIPPEFRNV